MSDGAIVGLLFVVFMVGAGWLAWSWGREELTELPVAGPEPDVVIFDEAAGLHWSRLQFPIGDVILPGDDIDVMVRRDGTVDLEVSKGVNTIWAKNAV